MLQMNRRSMENEISNRRLWDHLQCIGSRQAVYLSRPSIYRIDNLHWTPRCGARLIRSLCILEAQSKQRSKRHANDPVSSIGDPDIRLRRL